MTEEILKVSCVHMRAVREGFVLFAVMVSSVTVVFIIRVTHLYIIVTDFLFLQA